MAGQIGWYYMRYDTIFAFRKMNFYFEKGNWKSWTRADE
jgi:hypothetical protein